MVRTDDADLVLVAEELAGGVVTDSVPMCGHGSDHQRWPNRYFSKRGLFCLLEARNSKSPVSVMEQTTNW